MIGYGKRLLVVDDDEHVRLMTAAVLEEEGFSIVLGEDGIGALCEMQKRRFDAVVTDCEMPRLNGIDFLVRSRAAWPDTPVILMSGSTIDLRELALAKGAFAYIRKPVEGDLLRQVVLAAINRGVGAGSAGPAGGIRR